MSAETDLLPLPEYLRADYKRMATDSHEAECKHYARANVAHATAAKDAEIEALRAEVALLRVGAENERLHHRGLLDRERERADRLAEALQHVKQKLDDVAMIRGRHGAFAGTYMIVTEALHPTAAQENDDA